MDKILNENDLILRAKVDDDAFVKLYNYYFPKIYNYVRYRVESPYIADDITSSVFESVVHKFDTYIPDKGKFSSWIFNIAKNKVVDYYRKSSKISRVSIEATKEIASSQEEIEDQLILKEVKNKLFEALNTLSDRDRNIIALKFWSGLTNRDIAKIMDMTESNVGVIIYRAVRKLKEIMGKQGVSLYK